MEQYQITENNITYDIIKYSFGVKEWRVQGLLHRDGGPAIEYYDGSKYWYKNDMCHRDDGPAIELNNGIKEYWYNGKLLKNINSDEELKRYRRLLSIS